MDSSILLFVLLLVSFPDGPAGGRARPLDRRHGGVRVHAARVRVAGVPARGGAGRAHQPVPDLAERLHGGRRRHRPACAHRRQPAGAGGADRLALVARERAAPPRPGARAGRQRRAADVHDDLRHRQARRAGAAVADLGLLRHVRRDPDRDAHADGAGALRPHAGSATCSSACAATSRREQLRGALARALHDPTLTVAFWLPEYEAYADADGQPVEVEPAPGPRRSRRSTGRGSGSPCCEHDDALLGDPALLDAVTAAAALHARERAAAGRAARAAGRAAQLAVRASSRPRRTSAGGWSATSTTAPSSASSRSRSSSGSSSPATAPTPRRKAQIAALRGELSELAGRAARAGPRPAPGGAHRLRARRSRSRASWRALRCRCDLQLRLHDRLPAAHEVAAYYLVSESLTNVTKYAHASSVTVEVARTNGELVVEVVDDGCGGATEDERLGPARPGRPRGGARRAPARLEPRGGRHPRAGRDPVRLTRDVSCRNGPARRPSGPAADAPSRR